MKSTGKIRIVLVGFMGAGKTTVGRDLAKRLQCHFLDLDDEIVESSRRSIPEIFRESGEIGFRELERLTLRELVTGLNAPRGRGKKGFILAIGGGAFVQPENATLLREHGYISVFLDAPLEELRRRCAPQAAARPLFRDANLFRQLYERRRRSYMTADVRVDTAGKTPAQIAAEVATSLGVSA